MNKANTLVLEDPATGSMSGEIVLGTDNAFSIRMPGAQAGQGEIVSRR